MSGRYTIRDLPPLDGLLDAAGGLPGKGNRTAAATAWLRRVARRLQGEHGTPFYPMREVAALLRMSLADVARVYRVLEEEGLLRVRRSAPTLLAPREERPRRSIRGVVVLPVWQYAYCTWTDWRRFLTAMGEALRERHFAADFSLYGAREVADRSFAAGLRDKAPDYVLWFGMPDGVQQDMLALHDAGTKLIDITTVPSALPASHYVLQWDAALRRALSRYARSGVRRLAVVQPEAEALAPWLQAVLDASPLSYRVCRCQRRGPAQARRLLAALPRRRDTVIFSPSEDFFAWLARSELPGLCRHIAGRTWLTLHRLSLPFGAAGNLAADLVIHDWSALATRIAGDIADRRLPPPDAPQFIPAQWHPRARVEDFTQEF